MAPLLVVVGGGGGLSVSSFPLFKTKPDHALVAVHCNENPIYAFPEKELCGLSPNFHIRVSVSDLIFAQDQSTYFNAAE